MPLLREALTVLPGHNVSAERSLNSPQLVLKLLFLTSGLRGTNVAFGISRLPNGSPEPGPKITRHIKMTAKAQKGSKRHQTEEERGALKIREVTVPKRDEATSETLQRD